MLRILLLLLLVLHGLIHLMGLARAYGKDVQGLSARIPRGQGLLWGAAALLFVLAAVGMWRHSDRWWMWALSAVVLSQVLIVLHWHDARFGTVANVLVLAAVVLGIAVKGFRDTYRSAIDQAVREALAQPVHIVTEEDLAPLPAPVQRFLRAADAVGRPRPRVLRMGLAGELRGLDGPWFPFTSEQVNTFHEPARHFWIDATAKGLPTKGYHWYTQGHAFMRIKPLGLFTAVDLSGPEMDVSETVTWFNDLCLFAPGALIDPRMRWEAIDDRNARVTFTHGNSTITTQLVFDAEDRLVDFISDDRYCRMPGDKLERHRFTTPARDHRVIDGIRVPGYGEGVWHLPEGPFAYGRFHLRACAYDR